MTIEKRLSLRKCINDNCKNCIYDDTAAGTWRQQVTLCAVKSCAIYPRRPVSKAPIPENVLDYFQITGAERAFYRLSRPLIAPVSEHNQSEEYPSEGRLHMNAETGHITGIRDEEN